MAESILVWVKVDKYSRASDAELASDFKERGHTLEVAWSQFVGARNYRPSLDFDGFRRLFDMATPDPLQDAFEQKEIVLTHFDQTGRRLQFVFNGAQHVAHYEDGHVYEYFIFDRPDILKYNHMGGWII